MALHVGTGRGRGHALRTGGGLPPIPDGASYVTVTDPDSGLLRLVTVTDPSTGLMRPVYASAS